MHWMHLLCFCNVCVCGLYKPKCPQYEPHGRKPHYTGWYVMSDLPCVFVVWAQRKLNRYAVKCTLTTLPNWIYSACRAQVSPDWLPATDQAIIADVALRERHQWRYKIWNIFTFTSSRKSAKLFSRKLCRAINALNTGHNPVHAAYNCILAINLHVSYSIHLL